MKRTLLALLTAWFLLLSLPCSALAADLPRVVDNAGLLTADQAEDLEAMAQSLGKEYGMDVVILTEYSLGSQSPQDYADDYFDDNGYGLGSEASGVLLLLAMENRDWYISTHGDALYALTDHGIQGSMEEALRYFGDGDYYGGFWVWLSTLGSYFAAWETGAPADGYAGYAPDAYHGYREETVYYDEPASPNLLLSLGIGLAAAGITLAVMASGMNTKGAQRGAASYLRDGSFHLRTRQDLFLYSSVTKTARPQNQSSGGSRSGGGSSVHRSSSGRRHGGGGGKF